MNLCSSNTLSISILDLRSVNLELDFTDVPNAHFLEFCIVHSSVRRIFSRDGLNYNLMQVMMLRQPPKRSQSRGAGGSDTFFLPQKKLSKFPRHGIGVRGVGRF